MSKAKSKISTLRTARTFLKEGTCSETLMCVLDHAYDHPMKLEEQASAPLAGGLVQYGYQCGMLWGATLAAGAQAYRLLGPSPKAETAAITAAQRLAESLAAHYKSINCLEITDLNWKKPQKLKIVKFILKGGPIGCVRMAAKYAPLAFSEINTALSAEQDEVPSPPVSCAAILAQKMGASEMHRVMAAGFAGGIGLSGGACGALGAAVWIIGMNSRQEGVGNKVISSRLNDTVDKFIRSTDFKFECSEIVGRKFESVDNHAAYLHDGGCADIIELLATS